MVGTSAIVKLVGQAPIVRVTSTSVLPTLARIMGPAKIWSMASGASAPQDLMVRYPS